MEHLRWVAHIVGEILDHAGLTTGAVDTDRASFIMWGPYGQWVRVTVEPMTKDTEDSSADGRGQEE